MLFFAQSTEMNFTPEEVILGDIKSKKFIKGFKTDRSEILFGRIKKIFPYGKKFSTERAEIIPLEEVVYNFCGKLFAFVNNSFEKISIGLPMAKIKVDTPKKCKYKMFLTTFYDEYTQDLITKYMVEPN